MILSDYNCSFLFEPSPAGASVEVPWKAIKPRDISFY